MLGVILIGVILISIYVWQKISLSYWKRRGVPGPKPCPFVGNIGRHLIGKCTLGKIMQDIYKQYESYPFVGLYRATKPVLLVRDPDMIYEVLVKNFQSFRNNEFYLEQKSDQLFAHNPFLLRDKEWKDTRHLVTPGMTSGRMKAMYPILKIVAKNFVKFIENHPTASTDGIESRQLTKRLTIDYVAKSAFGIDSKSFDSYEDISEFNKLANQFLSPGTAFSFVFMLAQIFPVIIRMNALKLVSKNLESRLVEIISEVVEYRKKNNVQGKEYLQFLIDLSEEKHFGIKTIAGHASTFFLDAYETTSLVLSHLLLNLAQYPEYQDKIREEIRKHELENGGELTYEAIHDMPWLDACFYESFRYTPAADIQAKLCTEAFEYTPTNPDFKNMTVKLTPGDVVILPFGIICKDPKYFENPNKFMPERMFNKDQFLKSTFSPFSEGPRACIGRRLGIMQAKLGAAVILKNFRLSVSPKLQQPISYYPYHPLNEVKGGFWIIYTKIE
ncbi:hypothetical protein ABEB36_002228 [Hypothenemus hampei]|uniref:Cytochrome P450 n=1 Tax=Hypothenemus hampei TaxID=57062 RepID=A0ABD1F5M2_HYPHA